MLLISCSELGGTMRTKSWKIHRAVKQGTSICKINATFLFFFKFFSLLFLEIFCRLARNSLKEVPRPALRGRSGCTVLGSLLLHNAGISSRKNGRGRAIVCSQGHVSAALPTKRPWGLRAMKFLMPCPPSFPNVWFFFSDSVHCRISAPPPASASPAPAQAPQLVSSGAASIYLFLKQCPTYTQLLLFSSWAADFSGKTFPSPLVALAVERGPFSFLSLWRMQARGSACWNEKHPCPLLSECL